MGSMTQEQKPHAVCMPFPAQGHIHATLKLAKLLQSKGFHITFVHTEYNYNKIHESGGASSIQSLDGFRFETIPDGNASEDLDALCVALRTKFADLFRELLNRLNDPASGVPPVTCIVSDTYTSFTLEVAEEFGIPDVFFGSVSACGYLGMFYYKDLAEKGLLPRKSEDDLSNEYLNTIIDWLPGLKKMKLKDLPSFPHATDLDKIKFDYVKYESLQVHRASAVIFNTFDELERDVLEAMAAFLPPIYTIGPLTLLCRRITLENTSKLAGSNNLWKEDTSCLEWLKGRAPASVLYLNFGSLAVMTNGQLIEFAWGLANSGHNFLWIIRPDVVEGDSAVLPKEFLDDITGRGLLISWCPQEEVLMHPAIGGFLTHCGWNSSMESICAGVPMLCWSYFGDQQTNRWYACNEWGIGMELDDNVRREKVEEMIRELMTGAKGKEMRRRASEWKESAYKATEPINGKSFINLERVIKEVLLKKG